MTREDPIALRRRELLQRSATALAGKPARGAYECPLLLM